MGGKEGTKIHSLLLISFFKTRVPGKTVEVVWSAAVQEAALCVAGQD